MTISSTYREMSLELAEILSVAPDEVPRVFRSPYVKILKIGIDADLRERYPDASAARLSVWLERYTGSSFYLRRMKNRRASHRHDLDGNDAGEIASGARFIAFRRLKQRAANEKRSQRYETVSRST